MGIYAGVTADYAVRHALTAGKTVVGKPIQKGITQSYVTPLALPLGDLDERNHNRCVSLAWTRDLRPSVGTMSKVPLPHYHSTTFNAAP